MTLEKLSAAKLHSEIAKRHAAYYAAVDAMIRNGYGDMRGSDIEAAAKGDSLLSITSLCREYLALRAAHNAALDELDARKRWHGGDKPIKRVV